MSHFDKDSKDHDDGTLMDLDLSDGESNNYGDDDRVPSFSSLVPVNKGKMDISALNNRFRSLRLPDQHLSIDHSTVKYRARHSLKMHNSLKPHKRHFKKKCRPLNIIKSSSDKCGKRKFSASEEFCFMNKGQHWPVKVVNEQEKMTRGLCDYCLVVHRKENKTTIKCSTCKVLLCFEAKRKCFYDFHRQEIID